MALYLLDTNMCIYLMKNQPPEVAERFAACQVGDVLISAITHAELEYGVRASADPSRERVHLASLVQDIVVAPFDSAAALAYGPIRLTTRESKKDHLDKLIAAHAVSLGVIVVTNNVSDFAKYPGLKVENWLQSTGHNPAH
jgi:tRNA(fMet)-specific endonuclease VapC